MKIFVVGEKIETGHCEELQKLPQNRKATKNMLLALSASQSLLGSIKTNDRFALVLGSSFGELETTKDFLVALDKGMARPFLFQSSLHNATTGFLTMNLGITGPSITISQKQATAESVRETAQMLLQSGKADVVMTVVVESEVPGLDIDIKRFSKAVLFANEVGLETLGAKPLREIL
jgi:3-oxoacyl-(acyl-carrier-protein) synthase